MTRIYGVLGYPARHSLSPLMHNAALRALGIDAEYRIFEVKPEELEGFLEEMDPQIYGLNVTVPYKEKILDSVTLDPESFFLKQVGAVNTIVKRDHGWIGFNTDIPGFQKHLKEVFDPNHKKAALLGAGGAARAVCYALVLSGVREIAVFDIDSSKTKAIVEMVRALFPDFPISAVDSVEGLDIREKDLLVNATPVGMLESDPLLVPESLMHKGLFIYDLVYNLPQTRLLAAAEKAGAGAANGLGMLLYQGALSFRHFTGKPAPVEVMRQALTEGVQKT